MIEYVVAQSASALKFVSGISNLIKFGIKSDQACKLEEVLTAIRTLYFFRAEIGDLLERVANGELVSVEEIERARGGLERSGPSIEKAIFLLEEYIENNQTKIGLSALDDLKDLRPHKFDVRWAMEFLIENMSHQPMANAINPENQENAKIILGLVNSVNAALDAVDRELRSLRTR